MVPCTRLVITCTDTTSTASQASSLVHRWHLKWLLSHDSRTGRSVGLNDTPYCWVSTNSAELVCMLTTCS